MVWSKTIVVLICLKDKDEKSLLLNLFSVEDESEFRVKASYLGGERMRLGCVLELLRCVAVRP
jgi:hypothetical protein